jgi:uncharacterized protein (DUF1778 family)
MKTSQVGQSEQVLLSERDSLRILDALENPPAPNAKLLAAAHALPLNKIAPNCLVSV